MTNVQEHFPTTAIALPQNLPHDALTRAAFGASSYATLTRGDAIRRTGPQHWLPPSGVPPQSGGAAAMTSIISQLLSIIQQLVSMLGLGGIFNGQFGSEGADTYFQNANGSSTGDPHLAFSGTNGTGSNQQSRFDSMTGHPDLLDSDSFAGGFQVSTTVTQPANNGITFNRQATVSTNFGQTQVSLDNNGNATIVENGQSVLLAGGQSYDLGSGETVTRNSNGSLVVRQDNGTGGTITTTLSGNGLGVDVNAQANNVDLGGDLVNQPQGPAADPQARG